MTAESLVVAALIGGVVSVVTTLLTGYLGRPKTKADARAVNLTADVSVSADAREWALLWMKKAEDAEQRATHAEERMDELEERLETWVRYARALSREVERLRGLIPEGGRPDLPPPPSD